MSNVYKLDTAKTVHKLWSPKPKVNPAWRVGSASSVVNFDSERSKAKNRTRGQTKANKAFSAEFNRLCDRRRQVWKGLKDTDWYAAGGRYNLTSMALIKDRNIDPGIVFYSDPAAYDILVQLDLLTNEIKALRDKWRDLQTDSIKEA